MNNDSVDAFDSRISADNTSASLDDGDVYDVSLCEKNATNTCTIEIIPKNFCNATMRWATCESKYPVSPYFISIKALQAHEYLRCVEQCSRCFKLITLHSK